MDATVVVLSLGIQLVAAVLSLRLVRLTGIRAAWSLIAVALVLMALRRADPVFRLLMGAPLGKLDLADECVGMALSVLLVVGIAGIAPLLTARQRTEAALRAELEKRVAERATELEQSHESLQARTKEIEDARRVALSMMQDANIERQRAEDAMQKLEESTQSLRTLSRAVEQSPAVVVITDTQGTIEYVNPRFEEATGYSAEEAVGQNPRLLKSGLHPPEFYQAMWDTLAAGNIWHGELCNRRKNGELFWESASIAPVKATTGEPAFYVAVKEDVTERRRAIQEVEDARRAAEAANAAKSDFLANMSHELRTPLNAIIGFSEMLHDQTFGPLNPKQTRHIDHVLTASHHLLSLINDILDLAKVEAGQMDLDLSAVHLRALLQGALVLVRERALKHELALELDVPDDLVISADERKLKQVVFNLLSNAVKFTPDGGRVSVTAQPLGDGVLVSVADTGIGIRVEDQGRLFQEFEQLESGFDRKHQGTGLGLALSRTLVDLHGGRIWMESEGEGRGSVFRFTVPLVAGNGGAPEDGEAEP